jgi:hypothetical protein
MIYVIVEMCIVWVLLAGVPCMLLVLVEIC